MASKDEVTLEEMSSYPFASFEADASASDNFAEEVCMHNFNINQNHIYVIDRATMMNVLSHTNAFSIGTGILSEGYAGQALVSRPIANFGRDIHLGWIHVTGRRISPVLYDFPDKALSLLRDI